MDNVQSPEILDITPSSNQNGASLGEQRKGSNEAKSSVSTCQNTSQLQHQIQNENEQQQIHYASSNKLLQQQHQQHQILQTVPSDQGFLIPTQIFHAQIQCQDQQNQHQATFAYSFPVSSAYSNPVPSMNSSSVNYLKITSSNHGNFPHTTLHNSTEYTMHTIQDNIESSIDEQIHLKTGSTDPLKKSKSEKTTLQEHQETLTQTKDQSQNKDKVEQQKLQDEQETHFKKVEMYPIHQGESATEKNETQATPGSFATLDNHDETHTQGIVNQLIHTSTNNIQLEKIDSNDKVTRELETGKIQEDTDSSDEEDVHQCGRCKQLFNTLKLYMSHKASKVCKVSKTKVVTNIPDSSSSQSENQNILEAAANSTIFRDSFISMEAEGISNKDSLIKDFEVENRDGAKEMKTLILKFDQQGKRRRGRPPKNSHNETHSSNFAGENQEFDIGNPDSPPKAKRKSRPPRRHKPDEDLIQSNGHASSEQHAETYQTEEFNVTLSSLDPSGLPTVENIHKFFSRGRGRGRGRGRNRYPCHRCPICQLLFPNRLTMLEHRRKHSKTFKCKTCNEGFYTAEKLEKHSTKETHNYPCDQCDKIFVNKQALLRHKISHSDKVIKCDMCVRTFKTIKDLNTHKLGMHSETYDFVCEVCNKAFSRREKLKRHLMIHAPDRPIFTCPFKNHVGCEKTFYRKDKLTRHLYSHSKVKPFKCEQCDKSFARTDNLREHIRSHTGIFRYYCTVCGKGQPGPKKFVQHMFKQHNVENPQIPKPYEDLAPDSLIQQHKAVVQAENDARLAKAASNMKKEKEKNAQKLRKEELDAQEIHVDPSQGHVTLTMGNLALQAINAPTLIASPQGPGGERAELELYSNFQINRQQLQENIVRQIGQIPNDNFLRDSINARENRDAITRDAITQHDARVQEIPRHHIVESPSLNDAIRRQLSEATGGVTPQTREPQEQSHQQQAQPLPQAITVEAEGNIPVSTRGLQLIHQGVLPGNLQFTALLNSDLVAISDTVIRNQNPIPAMFQHK